MKENGGLVVDKGFTICQVKSSQIFYFHHEHFTFEYDIYKQAL